MSENLEAIARELLVEHLYDGPEFEAVYGSSQADGLSDEEMERVHDLMLADLGRIRLRYSKEEV